MKVVKDVFRKIGAIGLVLSLSTFALLAESKDEYIEMVKGNSEAPIKIVEYASFTCPHCATFHSEVFPNLKREYIDTGKVYFIYREVYFDAPGLWAGLLARCAGPEKYFGLVELLYDKQKKWTSGSSEQEIVKGLVAIGSQVGLGNDQISNCLRNKEKALNLVKSFQENTKKDSVSSTPSLLINGDLHSNLAYEVLKEKIDSLLD